MKREIEINRAVNSYISIYFGSYIRDVERAFRNGIEWADENPKNVWHPADEEPKDKYEILVQDEFGHFWLTNYVEYISHYQNGWKECAACECIIRWAYISDLLPKGGE